MEIYKKYFNEEFYKYTKAEIQNIDELLRDEMILISGDFYGIQDFIFKKLSNKYASKVLRAKSAFIQIFTEYIAKYICNRLNVDNKNILSLTAGKFEILIEKKSIEEEIEKIQNRINEYFLKNFFGLSALSISYIECKREDFQSEKYKELREKIIDKIEESKFQKFNLIEEETILEYDTNITNQTLCRVCNIRKIENENVEEEKKICKICNSFKKIGEYLVKRDKTELSTNEIGLYIDNFKTTISIDKNLKFYVAKDSDNSTMTFEKLAKRSCGGEESREGLKALAILKADVDNMGKFLEKSDVTDNFENFDTFSKVLNNFFSLYIPQELMRKKYKDSYTVFTGGDDLFLVGAWDEMLNLAREIESKFKSFVKSDKLTISFGIVVTKPSTPISYLAKYSDELLEKAKEIDNNEEVEKPKDAISLFGETIKWKKYKEVYKNLDEEFKDFEVVNRAILYNLLKFCDMSKKIEEDIRNAIWKSKLNYLFNRNIDKKYHIILSTLSKNIEENPEATKIFLTEFIYKRRNI